MMITQSSMLDFILKTPSSTSETRNQKSLNNNSFPKFNDILNNTVGKATRSNNDYNKPAKSETTVASNNKEFSKKELSRREPIKAFREIAKSSTKGNEFKKVTGDAKGNTSGNMEEISNEEMDKDIKVEVVTNVLAEVLGVSAEDLIKSLTSLGINPEDIADSSKLNDVINRLSEAMGLSTQQKEALTEILSSINKIADSSLKDLQTSEKKAEFEISATNTKPEKEDAESDWVKLDNPNIQVIKEKNHSQNLSQMAAMVKAKLEDIANKLQVNPQAVISDITEKVIDISEQIELNGTAMEETPVDDVKAVSQESTKNDKDSESNGEAADSEKQPDQTQYIKVPTAKEEKDTQIGAKFDSSLVSSQTNKAVETGTTEIKIEQVNNTVANNQTQKFTETKEVPKLQREVNIPKNELINQVVEKAKVIVGAEKSEMIMELKPESLGKLALKIVTERGMVVAKFIAENQQVKEIIETNMQLLKDTLKEQGLTVQGFSVSVGQDSYRGFNRNTEFGNQTKKGDGKDDISGISVVGAKEVSESIQNANPYDSSESKINLTA
ncbi:MAG: flagellar hook-length control protein FliK [Clostridia bacterium]|nr:flagellar hook-length control protein FliK [Clostridia bacterium]